MPDRRVVAVKALMNRRASVGAASMSHMEIEALLLSAALVVTPLMVAGIRLVRRRRIRRRRPQVSFLEVISGKS